MNAKGWIIVGSLLGAAGVAAGAIGAHGLRHAIEPVGGREASPASLEQYHKRLDNYEVAVRYQMIHAPALVLVGLLLAPGRRNRALQLAGCFFLAGIVLFSGFLYAWVLLQSRWLVHVVPIGGTALIAGWIAMAVGAARAGDQNADPSAA